LGDIKKPVFRATLAKTNYQCCGEHPSQLISLS
jgi:hypothetical protein